MFVCCFDFLRVGYYIWIKICVFFFKKIKCRLLIRVVYVVYSSFEIYFLVLIINRKEKVFKFILLFYLFKISFIKYILFFFYWIMCIKRKNGF